MNYTLPYLLLLVSCCPSLIEGECADHSYCDTCLAVRTTPLILQRRPLFTFTYSFLTVQCFSFRYLIYTMDMGTRASACTRRLPSTPSLFCRNQAGCTFCETAQFYGGRRCAAVDTQCELAVSDCTTFCSSGTGNDTCADCQGTSTEGKPACVGARVRGWVRGCVRVCLRIRLADHRMHTWRHGRRGANGGCECIKLFTACKRELHNALSEYIHTYIHTHTPPSGRARVFLLSTEYQAPRTGPL